MSRSSPEPSRPEGPRNLNRDTFYSHHAHMVRPSGVRANVNMNINSGERRNSHNNDNTENRFELFLLGDGEKKVTEETDTRKSTLAWS